MRKEFSILILVLIATSQFAKADTLLVYGDSLSAAYGMEQSQGWVNLLSQRLALEHPHYEVINASVSGETTGGGVTRLPKTLQIHQPDIIIIELGGNDGLRGYPIYKIRDNLRKMINSSADFEAKILLVGMVLPPNYGRRYTSAFEGAYSDLASEFDIPFVPFLLDGVTTERDLIQRDGIHPTPEAQPKLVEDIWPTLLPLLTALPDQPKS